MTNDDTNDDARERRLAMTALALQNPEPAPGTRPSLGELWDWMAKKVPAARAEEIRMHLARDPELYEEWRELRLALAEEKGEAMDASRAPEAIASPPVRRATTTPGGGGWFEILRDWLSPATLGGAFATVAALGVAIVLSQGGSPEPAEFWEDWQVPKSVESVRVGDEERPELRAFLVGMQEQMRELSIAPDGPDGRPLPDSLDACESSDAPCNERREALRSLGKLTVLSRWECVLGTDKRRDRQRRAGEILRTLESEASIGRLIAPLQDWANAESVSSRCGAISELVARGLVAHDSLEL